MLAAGYDQWRRILVPAGLTEAEQVHMMRECFAERRGEAFR